MKIMTVLVAISLLIWSASAALADPCAACHSGKSGISQYGVHARGVGNCNMCHIMHNSQDGALVDPDHPDGNQWLLVAETPSDVCLNCHAGVMGNVFGDDPQTPPPEVGGGNFTFLLEDNLNDGYQGALSPIPGDKAGHSILAPSRGVGADGTLAFSPGGTFPSSKLGCTSCHDPHGNQNFRMLYGVGSVQDGAYFFTNPAPLGFGLSIYHGRERQDRHTAYFSGFSAWCGNCHGDFHRTTGKFLHPNDITLGTTIVSIYNTYNGTADPYGAETAMAYLATVPFEDPGHDYKSTAGATASSKIMCLSCHRAHATSAPLAGRWDFNVTKLAEDGVESGSYALPNPYADDRQRSLCNKCHREDAFDL